MTLKNTAQIQCLAALAKLDIPDDAEGDGGFYYIRHSEIRAAKNALNTEPKAPPPETHAELNDGILEVLRQHDRCPPEARDADRRAKTARLILQKLKLPAPVQHETADYHELLMRLQAVQHSTDRPYAASVAKDAGDAIKSLLASRAPAQHHVDAEAEIASVVQSVNEWDDRTSPDDYPDHLLITSEELADILRNFAATLEGK